MVARERGLVTIPEEKVVFCGGDIPRKDPNCRVGKSSFVQKLVVGYSIGDYPTLGVEAHPLDIVRDGFKYKYNIFDVGSYYAGNGINNYFVGANYVFICYNSEETKNIAETYWKEKVPENANIFYLDTSSINIKDISKKDLEDMLMHYIHILV